MDGIDHKRISRLIASLHSGRRKSESMRAYAKRIGVPRSTLVDIMLKGCVPRKGTVVLLERQLQEKS